MRGRKRQKLNIPVDLVQLKEAAGKAILIIEVHPTSWERVG
jgi:hypothetical protein